MRRIRNKKGFILIETIIVVVILLTTLISVYSVFGNNIRKEKRRMYYDDVAYLFKTMQIRDVINENIDISKFRTAVNNNLNCKDNEDKLCKYIFVFNSESDLFLANNKFGSISDFYNVYRYFYIKIEDINSLKQCLNNSDNSIKCENTKKVLKTMEYSNIKEYLLSLNVKSFQNAYNGHDAILISLIFETKNGNLMIEPGKYEDCIEHKVFDFYDINLRGEDTKKEYLKNYNKNDNLSFNMSCENAYYISWVYL